MSETDFLPEEPASGIAKLPLLAALIALFGLGDAIYLTIHHYTYEPVPCGGGFDCGAVLTSQYATIGDIPLAAFGAAAYFIAFSLALLAAFGNRLAWKLFGLQTALMAAASIYFVYLQAFVIHSYCLYCLVSATTSVTLFIVALASRFWRR
ncbi:MAG TPA: vitamin K epoxide reductase family protein [Pyrinomonadaceae bacterium]|jgi:uncharacterized membrane protein